MGKGKDKKDDVVVYLDDSATCFEDHLNFSEDNMEQTSVSASDKLRQILINEAANTQGWFAKYGWIVLSFGAAICYTTFNVMTANFIKSDPYAAKVVNSMVLGAAAMLLRLFKKFIRGEEFTIGPGQ